MILSALLSVFLSILCLVQLVQYLWSKRSHYIISSQLSGPTGLPIIGNALQFNCKNEDAFEILRKNILQYERPSRFWLGPKLILIFSDLSHVERILSSTKMTYKSNIYACIQEILGNGLISGSGKRWKEDRKVIQPIFSLKYVQNNISIMQEHSNLLMSKLEEMTDKGYVDVHDAFHTCFFDMIGQLVFGKLLNTQNGESQLLLQCYVDMYDNVFEQMIKPWLHPKIFFNMTSYKPKRDHIRNTMKEEARMAIHAARKRLHNAELKKENEVPPPVVDQLVAFLEEKPNLFTEEELIDHINTIFAASEDTSTITVSILCVLFGMYPEYQEICAQEILNVFGNKPREVTNEDVQKLHYLEMCIKDALRLATIAPFIIRETTEEFQVDKYTIPPGCDILIPIFEIHRDPTQWENPLHFYPDHFLPENVAKRNLYAYLPFSIGPRGCIGKILAIHLIKVCMANVMQRFQFQAVGKFPDIKLKSDISIRPVNGYRVQITKRKWE